MRNKLSFFALLAATALIIVGCGGQSGEDDAVEALPFSLHVEAFTHGHIARTSPVYLILSKDMAEDKLTQATLKKAMKIKPAVDGEFSFENARTVVFKPDSEFERGKTYTVTADFRHLLDAPDKEKEFSYKFTTLPISLRANFESISVNEKDESAYDVLIDLYTPDRETPEVVESLVKVSENGDMEWSHATDGKKHQLTIRAVGAGKDGVRVMNISVASNKLGLAKDSLLSVYIPGRNEFGLYDIVYVSEPERYIEATFTKILDPEQDLSGLAYIEDNKDLRVTVDGNKLRLYPDAGHTGVLSIGLDAQIKSKGGLVLQEHLSRKVEISSETPSVRFIGEGVIVPQSTQVLVPFHAIYLRGVVVRVIKITQQNIGQFLQVNHLNSNDELMRVGRIMARKTIFLDEDGQDLTKWGTYAVDLKQLIEPEQGAIYRIELSLNKDLSAYPCNEKGQSKEQILAEDEVKFKEEQSRFDQGGYYYYNDYNWSNYSHLDRDNPCTNSFYLHNDTKVGRNVLATNLGLITKSGDNSDMVIMVHDLLTTRPVRGVDVKVYNYQGQQMGHGTTDGNGFLKADLAHGKPYYVVAAQDKQRSYLRVDNGSALSLSAFDVSGTAIEKGLKGYIYGDRGVWRPGDIMYLSFMLCDQSGKLPADHPVVMELYNPLGQLYLKRTQTKGALGIYSFEMATEHDAPTGAWEVKVHVGGVVFSKRVRVEAIKPNRLKIQLGFDDKTLVRNESITGDMHVEWLQGAVAHNLAYEIDASFNSAPTNFAKFKGFNFDDPTKTFDAEETSLTSGTTDERGDAKIQGRFNIGDHAPGMLMANFNTRVYEESGDFSIDAVRLPFSPYNKYVGIKSPQKSKEQLNTGSKYTFEVASVSHSGEPVSGADLDVTVYKIYWYWWWSSDKSRLANYLSDSYSSKVKELTVTTKSGGMASFDLNFTNDEWGTYYISVKDRTSGHSTGIAAYFDWPYLEGRRDMDGSDAANKLKFKTNKETYAPGEKMTITLPSSKGSRAVISIENGSRVLSVSGHDCKVGETNIQLDVTADMQPNVYVHITLLQPHAMTINDLPIRMYGVVPVTVTSPDSYLHPVLKAPEEIKPEQKYEITVSEKNGKEMAYTVAIVDEGLLDLTRFQTPNPWGAFNAREALGVNTWDMYNYVVGAYGGRIEQLFSIGGDDELAGGKKAIVNRFKPVVQFDGPFILKRGSKQKHTYTMPNYNGRVRMMIVAGNAKAYGNAEKSVMVRKSVMLLGTLPRVIGMGEEMVVPATVFATEKGVGNVKVSIACSGNMQIMGPASQDLNFSEITDKQAMFRIKVGNKSGAGKITLTAVSNSDRSVYETEIEIRSVRRSQTKVVSATVEAGKSWKSDIAMPGADGTNKLTLEVSDVQPVNLTSRLSFLLGYPHGCIEQITSKGFPQLYLKQFASLTKDQHRLAEESVKEVIRRQRSYQVAEGCFSYWPGGTSSNAWGSIYAIHFQLEAEAKGYLVAEDMKRNALNNLRLVARNWKPVNNYYSRSEEITQAYRLYVLALANSPELGAMNRMKENAKLSQTSKWTLAAAYAQSGRGDVAKVLSESTADVKSYVYGEYDYTYGSNVRDKALKLIALTLMGNVSQAAILCSDISKELSSESWMSTQSTGFALVALSQYMNKYKVADDMEFIYNCEGKRDKVKTTKNIWSETLLDKTAKGATLEVKNDGAATLFVRVITQGIPEQGEEQAYSHGLGLSVSHVDMSGRQVDITKLAQGTNFQAVVTVKNPAAVSYNNIVLTQIFPAGWEILNTRFTNENAVDSYPLGIDYQDVRDDRVYTYMDRLPSGRQVTVRINLAAVYAGVFYCPPVYAEAMYDNLVRANTKGGNVVVGN